MFDLNLPLVTGAELVAASDKWLATAKAVSASADKWGVGVGTGINTGITKVLESRSFQLMALGIGALLSFRLYIDMIRMKNLL
jgi:hypothetical protein